MNAKVKRWAIKALHLYNADTYEDRVTDLDLECAIKNLGGMEVHERIELTVEAMCQGIMWPKDIEAFVEAGMFEDRYDRCIDDMMNEEQ